MHYFDCTTSLAKRGCRSSSLAYITRLSGYALMLGCTWFAQGLSFSFVRPFYLTLSEKERPYSIIFYQLSKPEKESHPIYGCRQCQTMTIRRMNSFQTRRIDASCYMQISLVWLPKCFLLFLDNEERPCYHSSTIVVLKCLPHYSGEKNVCQFPSIHKQHDALQSLLTTLVVVHLWICR